MKKLLVVLSLVLSGCSSQFTPYGNWANDIVGGTDENFTNGFELGVQLPKENMNSQVIAVMETLPAFRLFPDDPKFLTHGKVGVRQEMYTPGDLRTSEIVEQDNPYGGATAVFIQRINADDKARITTELEAGISGPNSGAEWFQKHVHTTLGFGTDPKGWDNQLEEEPLLNLNHSRIYENNRVPVWKLEFVDHTGAQVRFGNKAIDARVSKPIMFGYNPPLLDNSNSDDWSIYLFAEPYVKATGHNLFYDGTMFRDSPHNVTSEPLSAGVDSGVAVGKGNYILKFHYNVRTRDYKEQEDPIHSYGLFSIGVKW